MFHDRNVNAKINHIHERALGLAYQDCTSSSEELLITDMSVSFHQRNLQLFVTKVYQTGTILNPSFVKQILVERDTSELLTTSMHIYLQSWTKYIRTVCSRF